MSFEQNSFLNKIHFLRVLGKGLRNNAPPIILTHHPVFPPISQTLLTLVRHPRHPCQHIAHFSHIGAPPMSATLACNPHQHISHAGMSPTLADLPRKHATCDTHVSTKRMPFLKLLDIQLALEFQEKIQQFLLLDFIYTAFIFTFYAFLSIFI